MLAAGGSKAEDGAPGPGLGVLLSSLFKREPAEWGVVSCQPLVQWLWGQLLS